MVERFDREAHYPLFCEWWVGHHKVSPPISDYLPETGFVANRAAMGFLIKTDTCTAIVEFLTTDPTKPKLVRSVAIRAVALALRDEAKRLGFKHATVIASGDMMDGIAVYFGLLPRPDLKVLNGVIDG